MSTELPKAYDPRSVEERWARLWLEKGYFHADATTEKPAFSMVIPPPNITGSLHIGHALNNTLQDILARWKRMCGYSTLWIPGTDHAGIATQNVVERQLAAEATDRHDLGRAEFINRIWQWKETSGGTILRQLKRLGASCDWDRERFTLDEGLSRAVREVFVRLHQEGLIYRAQRLINWCTRCRTALSDIEVDHEEIAGRLYSIKYPLADAPEQFLTVATTRPETLLGDTAVAVHPEDHRYSPLIGKRVRLPLTHRTIPVVGDPILVDLEFGTGAVKITPGHDFNDEQAGKRHHLEKISLIDYSGEMNAYALEREAKAEADLIKELTGKTMAEARAIVLRHLERAGALIGTEEHRHALGKCYRCRTVVEPFDSPQWFVKVNDPNNSLAQPAIDAVRRKKIRLIPEGWEANYFGWMENIQDWCISRQIWWGHRIPAWYCKRCNKEGTLVEVGNAAFIGIEADAIVAGSPPASCPRCGATELIQDPDVLDTWFSSALWPFSTLGWPPDLQPDPQGRVEAERLLARFYPTATLVSAFDILFFWIARMIMMGLHFMKEVPFREVYIHALVRDAEGQKMSKSKGNVMDPLDVMDRFGTDALRFTLAAMASPGRDIRLTEDRIEGYRNFANKIWNAARFALMHLPPEVAQGGLHPQAARLSLANRWIQSRLDRTVGQVHEALEAYRFDGAAGALYQFIWHAFCDWYLEMIKVDLQEGEPALREETHRILAQTFETLLRLLHPFMPFLTEELGVHFPHEGESLAVAAYPERRAEIVDTEAEADMENVVIGAVVAIRNLRGEMSIPYSEELAVSFNVTDPASVSLLKTHLPYIQRLARARVEAVGTHLPRPPRSATIQTPIAEAYIPLEEDRVKREVDRLEKTLLKLQKEREPVERKCNDPNFTTKAPPEVVEKLTRQRTELQEKREKIERDLKRLRQMLASF